MEKLTYKQAYDKIIDAYFKDQIIILNCQFCFCGTLSPDQDWHYDYIDRAKYHYSFQEYGRMEKALFSSFPEIKWCYIGSTDGESEISNIKNYENKLFAGMCAALDVLKQIHIERGEMIDELPLLNKRVLIDPQRTGR